MATKEDICSHLLGFVEGQAGPIGFNRGAHHSIKQDFLNQFFVTCWEGQKTRRLWLGSKEGHHRGSWGWYEVSTGSVLIQGIAL